jgi:hypothetical protein
LKSAPILLSFIHSYSAEKSAMNAQPFRHSHKPGIENLETGPHAALYNFQPPAQHTQQPENLIT